MTEYWLSDVTLLIRRRVPRSDCNPFANSSLPTFWVNGVNALSVVDTTMCAGSFSNEIIRRLVVSLDILRFWVVVHRCARNGFGVAVIASAREYSENSIWPIELLPINCVLEEFNAFPVCIRILTILNPFCCNAFAYERVRLMMAS